MFTLEEYKNLLAFLLRAEMKGEEAIVYTGLYIKLTTIIKEMENKEVSTNEVAKKIEK